jgi:hypothetical protein
MNLGTMDDGPLDPQSSMPASVEAEKKLFERLNRREIRQSAVPVPAHAHVRHFQSVLSPTWKGPVTAARMQTLIAYAHKVLWERLVGGGYRVSTVKLDCYPEALLTNPKAAVLQSRYGLTTDIIHIVFPQEKLEDPFCVWPAAGSGQPATWETELLHELIHENQFKVVKNVSAEGRDMYARETNRFPGKNHDERFYTAICACAKRLGISSQELRQSI